MRKKERHPSGGINHFRAQAMAGAARCGMTMSALATSIGWTPGGLATILNRATPAPHNIELIAGALGISQRKLMSPITPEEWFEATVPRFE